jgi:hypothetical protein
MQIITVILSSAVIASIVSIILGYVFENKRYLKDKKLAVYTEFLEQLDHVFPAEDIFGDSDRDKLVQKMRIETSKLEKYIWKIKLLSRNADVHEHADKLFEVSEKLIDSLTSDTEDHELEKIIDESETLREELISEMNRDIGRF